MTLKIKIKIKTTVPTLRTPVSIRHFGTGPAAERRCHGPPWNVPLAAPRRLFGGKEPDDG